MRSQQRGDARDIAIGQHLHHIRADDVRPAAQSQQAQRLGAAEPAAARRAGAGREGRIDAVDVEGQIRLVIAQTLDELRDLLPAVC